MRQVVLLAISIGFATACGENFTQPGATNGALRLKTELSAPTFKEGSAVAITITASNSSADTLMLTVGCIPLVRVRWKSQEVYPGNVACPGIEIPPVLLAPGASHVQTVSWNGEANLPTTSGIVPPGSYSVQGQATYKTRAGDSQLAYGPALSVTMVP